ncbi:MAG: PKD domain-containing protein [Thermoplasmatales archaeon]|nr:MAG: PKD domain-containing protein [Thermoplasmatales archaeon]
MKRKIVVPILCIAVAVGMLSGCVEEVANIIPVASFTYTPTENIYVDTLITFTDASTDEDGTIASWSWDFGDGTNSTDKNPTHSYAAVDIYTVTLIVTDNDGNASDPYTMDITVSYVPPTAAFDYTPMVNITTATEITFTDNSTVGDANITTWAWDFGDGDTSNVTNPTHTYAAAGNYTVTLTVTDENEETDTTEEIVIEVTEAT